MAMAGKCLGDSGTASNKNCSSRWYFEKYQLESTPSQKCGITSDKELFYRQQASRFIQDIGVYLRVNQLCINTAIVYMHRFYMHHSFSHFHRNDISVASLYLATKVEEQPRELEHVMKGAHHCFHQEAQPPFDVTSPKYLELCSSIIATNENVLLLTLGFDIIVTHPHTYVVKCCQHVRASRELTQASCFLATQSHHLTTFCLQYSPKLVACVCIYIACKWSNYEIPPSNTGKQWFSYVDDTVTLERLETIADEFLTIFKKSPTRLQTAQNIVKQILEGKNATVNSAPVHPTTSKNIAENLQSTSSSLKKIKIENPADSQ